MHPTRYSVVGPQPSPGAPRTNPPYPRLPGCDPCGTTAACGMRKGAGLTPAEQGKREAVRLEAAKWFEAGRVPPRSLRSCG